MQMTWREAWRDYVRENRADPSWHVMILMYAGMLAFFVWMLTPWFPW